MSHVTINIEPIDEYEKTNFPIKNKSKRDEPEENSSLVVYCLLVSITILATLFAVALSMIVLGHFCIIIVPGINYNMCINSDNVTTCKPTIACDCNVTDTENKTTSISHPNLPPESSTTEPTPTVTTTTKPPKYVVDFWVETSSLNNVKKSKVVTFDYVYHNDGSIDINSGIFTAPQTQTYSFLVDAASSIELQVNGLTVDYDKAVNEGTDQVFSEKRIKLNKGDRVNLFDNGSPSVKTYEGALKSNRSMGRKITFFGKSVGDNK